jgi:hypothetical protein
MNKETSEFDSHLTLVDYTRKIAGRKPVLQYQSVVNDTEVDRAVDTESGTHRKPGQFDRGFRGVIRQSLPEVDILAFTVS